MNKFDADTHTYTIDGVPVPSVTQVLGDLIPGWQASEWHLNRGTAVHACAAMIARGEEFDYDPQITGQVAACRRFFAEVKPNRLYKMVERPMYSQRYGFAGTVDMIACMDVHRTVFDWKASFSAALPYQLAAYSILEQELFKGSEIRRGIGVQLRDDGTYQMSQVYDLRRYKQGFLALLTAYNIRRECKVKEQNGETE